MQMWDISKFFDKEMDEDAILTGLNRNTNKNPTRIRYKFNKYNDIKLISGVGMGGKAEYSVKYTCCIIVDKYMKTKIKSEIKID